MFTYMISAGNCTTLLTLTPHNFIAIPDLTVYNILYAILTVLKSKDKHLTLNLPTTSIVAQPFNVIKWQLKFNPVA